MPTLHVVLDVKFRAFNITFGTVHFTKVIPLPLEAVFIQSHSSLVNFNQNGVSLLLTLVPQS